MSDLCTYYVTYDNIFTFQWFFNIIGYFLHHHYHYCCWLRVGAGVAQTDVEGMELGQPHGVESLLQARNPGITNGMF